MKLARLIIINCPIVLTLVFTLANFIVSPLARAEEGSPNTTELPVEPASQVEDIVEDNILEDDDSTLGPVYKRVIIERLSRDNRFLLTPHRRNFLLPISYHDAPNQDPYQGENTSLEDLDYMEAEIQFSIKVLLRENIFGNNGHLYMGYTNHAFWQLYSDHDSAPFRETNHEPELILNFYSDLKFLGISNVFNEVILNHQSNGQGGLLSRSWNRVMLRSVFEYGNLAFSFTPWVRINEDEKDYELDPDGDDNPDIIDYMGHFEFDSAYKYSDTIFSVMVRNNFSKGNSTFEMGWSFPLSKNLRGYSRYFDGYGHSLIDYNSRQRVFSLGVVFTDLF